MNQLTDKQFQDFFAYREPVFWQDQKKDLQPTLDFWTEASVNPDITFKKAKWSRAVELIRFCQECYFCNFCLDLDEPDSIYCESCPIGILNQGLLGCVHEYTAWDTWSCSFSHKGNLEVKQGAAKQILDVCQQTMDYIDRQIAKEKT